MYERTYNLRGGNGRIFPQVPRRESIEWGRVPGGQMRFAAHKFPAHYTGLLDIVGHAGSSLPGQN